MKRLAIVLTALVVLLALAAVACAPDFSAPNPENQTESGCVTCHSDKDMLIASTAPPTETPEPEEPSGEG